MIFIDAMPTVAARSLQVIAKVEQDWEIQREWVAVISWATPSMQHVLTQLDFFARYSAEDLLDMLEVY